MYRTPIERTTFWIRIILTNTSEILAYLRATGKLAANIENITTLIVNGLPKSELISRGEKTCFWAYRAMELVWKGIEFEDQTQCLSQSKAWLLPKNDAKKKKTAHISSQINAIFF